MQARHPNASPYRVMRCMCTLAGSGLLGFATTVGATAVDPLEGKWLGTVGSTREQIEVGLEFRRDTQGALELRLTQPVSNYFDEKVDGALRRSADQVTHEALALTLTLQGDRLVGTYPGPNSQANFRRVLKLPTEQAPPKVPKGPEPRWQSRIGAQVYASPAVADGVAYVGNTGGVFNAVDVADGRIVWAFAAGGPILGAALVHESAVYFVADGGFLFKLNRSDGKEIWRYALADGTAGRVMPHPQVFAWDWQGPRPLLADGVVFVGAGDGGFHAVDAATGIRRWRFETRGRIRNGAALDGERVVFGSADHHVYALQRASGKEVWRFDTGAEVDADPVESEGKVLIGNRGGGLYSLDAQTGLPGWRSYFWGSWVESTPRVVDGVIYIGSSDLRRINAIDPTDGRVLWRSDVFGWSWGTPLVTPEHLYVGVAGGTPYFIKHVASLSKLDRRTGRILTRWPLPDTGGHQWGIAGSPVLAGDTLLVASIEGSLYGFPHGTGKAVSPEAVRLGTPIAPGITLIAGGFSPGRQPDGNSVIFEAPEGLVVLDTGRHPAHSQEILDFAAQTRRPIVSVLNSHWHLDHISGNPRLRRQYPTLKVYASPAIEGAMAGFLARSRLQALDYLAQPGDPARQAEVRADVESIESGPALYPDVRITSGGPRVFAGLRLELGYEAHSVTEGDLWFYEPSTRVLATGDLVTLPAPFFDTACPARWQSALRNLEAVEFETLIPGHGAPMSRSDFATYRQAFDTLLACADSDAEKSECIAGWQRDAAAFLDSDQDRRQAADLLDYYFDQHLRATARNDPALCGTQVSQDRPERAFTGTPTLPPRPRGELRMLALAEPSAGASTDWREGCDQPDAPFH